MVTVVISVLVISAIAAMLALVLVIAERFIANYGECTIDINGKKQLKVQGGKPLLNELVREKIFIPSACGGRGTCGYCKVKVIEGARSVLPTETPFLDEKEIADNIRLSCQVKVRNDIRIELPEELLSVQEYACKCTGIEDLTADIKLFRLEFEDSEVMDYRPGQYIQLLTPVYKSGGEEVYRAYSIASDPAEKNIIELIIRLVPGGICTTYCFEYLKVGDTVRINGPYGEFHLSDSDSDMVFVAGGSGMAPLRCMLYHMKNTNSARKTVYYFGANLKSELFLLDQMEDFVKQLQAFEFVPVVARVETGDQWEGQTGLVTEALERGVKNAAESEAYLCGSPGMIDAAVKVLKDMGVGEDKIFYDKFE